MILVILLALVLAITGDVFSQATPPPGGFVENQGGFRARWTQSQINAAVPAAVGPFTFPSPYNTRAYRITNSSDCTGSQDCVLMTGYSYWRTSNAHVSDPEKMYFFITLYAPRGGTGPNLYRYNKLTDTITKVGPLFNVGDPFRNATGEQWYFHPTLPTKLLIHDGPRLRSFDVEAKTFNTIFDVTTQFGANRMIWQPHSNGDGTIHSAALRISTGDHFAQANRLGCVIYNSNTGQFTFIAKTGVFDECQIDKSGRYVLMQQNTDGQFDTESTFVDLQTMTSTTILDQNGGLGHADSGYGYFVGMDNWNAQPGAAISWSFPGPTVPGGFSTRTPHFRSVDFFSNPVNHPSHTNANNTRPFAEQVVCGSNADTNADTNNEITCFRMDLSGQQLIVAPVMTNMNATGGGIAVCFDNSYCKLPKGNLSIDGKFMLWTTNLGGNRLDAFMVRVPTQLLVADSPLDLTPPVAPSGLQLKPHN